MPSRQLAKNAYRKLLDEIAGIYDSALKDARLAVEAILKTAYWKIGERVVETEQDGSIRAAYGSHLLENISQDMSKTNRKGFSVTNLRNMRLVYEAFSIHQISDELGWSHYVVLSVIKDKKERRAYFEKAVTEKWSVPQLREILIHDQVKTIPSDNGAVKRLAAAPAKVEVPRLAFKRGIINAYRVAEPRADSLKKKNNGVWLDCGFHVTRKFKLLSTGSVKPGDVVALTESSEGAARLKKITARDFRLDSILYTYAAQVVKVIDGDTLNVEAKQTETSWIRKKLRLRRINCPEIDTPEGKRAKDFVVKALKDCPWIVIKTYSTDIHDRYLVDVFYLPASLASAEALGKAGPAGGPGCDDSAKIALEGRLLNQELLDAGLAELWPPPASFAFGGRTPDLPDLAMLN